MHVRVSRQVIDWQGFSSMETKDGPGAFLSAQSQLSIRLDRPLTVWIENQSGQSTESVERPGRPWAIPRAKK